MMDLHDRLDRLAGPEFPVTDDQVAADVTRGRRALRRRRTVTGTAAAVFALAAVTAGIGYGTARPSTPAVSAPATRLVDYHGEQPRGYTIDKVPDGWEIQGVDNYVLTIAPKGLADRDPNSFTGKIAVMLQSKDQKGTPDGVPVTVGGRPGVIANPESDRTRTLYVKQPDGVNLQVQIWDARGWSTGAIVDFGAGIHVLEGAQQGVG
jgi:hypothetical protein